jgi:soluble lytic murein transglycosylase-like protein
MEQRYIKKTAVTLVILGLLGVNGFYFLLAGLASSDPVQFKNRIDLPLPFTLQDRNLSHLTLTPQKIEGSVSTYDHWIRAACRKHSLDPALVKAVIHAESQFDPLALSPRGAAGLMQLDPVTIRELGIKDPFDPKHNIDGGVRYLKDLLDTFEGDHKLALAAYNAGPNQVHKHNGVPPFKDTQKYLDQVFRYLAYYQKNKAG